MVRLACLLWVFVVGCSSSSGGGGSAGGTPFPTGGGFNSVGGGTAMGGGAGGGAAGGTAGGAAMGTQNCPWLVTCATNCAENDQACLNTCGGQATSAAVAQYNALVECSNTNNCQTDACVQQNCGAALTACVGAAAMDGGSGGGAGGGAASCLPNTVGRGVTSRAGTDEFDTTITAVNGDRVTSTVSTGRTVFTTSVSVVSCSQSKLVSTTDLVGTVTTYSPPLDTLPSAFTVGHLNTVTATTSILLMGTTPCSGTVEKRYSVLANEPVTVPAGTFQSVKFQVTSTATTNCANGYGSGNATDTLWFVAGVGPVKTESGGSTSEVISIR